MFKRQTHSFKSHGVLESPFAKAAQVWDERLGSARVQARNWRLMAFAALGLGALLGGGLLYQSSQTRVEAFIAQVDPQGRLVGEVQLLDRGYMPTAAQVAFHIAELVRKVRSRPADPVILKQNWEEAYRYLAGDAVISMSEYGSHAGLDDPAKADTTISVEIISVLQRSDSSYEVRWKETHFDHGSQSSVSYWTGLFTITIKPPTTARAVFDNPLGVYVTSFTWSQEFAGN
jgi:type IV secretion system protein TrbF